MLKMLRICLWLVVAMIALAVFDQVMVRIPLQTAGFKQAQTFYVDFRQRLLGLTGVTGKSAPPSIEQVIETTTQQRQKQPSRPQPYLYVDERGALQFVDSFEQVPEPFRKDAQSLAE